MGEHRLAEVGVGVHVVLAFRRGGQSKLHCRGEVVENCSPSAFVVGSAAVAFVDHDEVEEVRRIVAELGRRVAVLWRATHERPKDCEEQASVFRHLAFLADLIRLDAHHCIFRECREGVERLIGQNVAIGEEQVHRA